MSNKKNFVTNLLDFSVKMDTIGVEPPGKYTYNTQGYPKGCDQRGATTRFPACSLEGCE